MDFEIEMSDAADITYPDDSLTDLPPAEDILQPDEPPEPGEISDDELNPVDHAESTVVLCKIHLRGLHTLHTDDVKAYVKAHFEAVERVEWIDDNAANLVFASEPTAREAIVALSAIHIADATALTVGENLPAKPFQGRPELNLQVRFAVDSDRKQAGAALRSRYYLLHPEHDPEEKRRKQQERRSVYRDREYDNFRRSERRRRRASDKQVERFEASMYDDKPTSPRERQRSEGEEDGKDVAALRAIENRGKELFANRTSSSRRQRSASPRRSRDSQTHPDDLARSSLSNRTQARSIKGRLAADAKAKELFPSKSSTGGGGQLDQLERSIGSAHLKDEDIPKIVAPVPISARTQSKLRGNDLFSQRRVQSRGQETPAALSAKELFPDRLGGSNNSGKELLLGSSRVPQARQKAEDLFL